MNASTEPVIVVNGNYPTIVREFCFYQDMPIKLAGSYDVQLERRLNEPLMTLLGNAWLDFRRLRGDRTLLDQYVYLSVKRLPQQPGRPFTRPGWHCDGFRTDDITYLWSDNTPTEFSRSNFDLLGDEHTSMARMEEQALPEDTYTLPDRSLIRMDARCVHRPGMPAVAGVRTLVKLTFSRDRFDLEGNTHNYELDYDWPMRPRSAERNVPQEKKVDRDEEPKGKVA